MESVEQVQDITSFLGGGWVSVVIGVLVVIIFGWVKHAEKKAKRDAAEKETDINRQQEQAQTSEENNQLQDKWDDAQSEIDQIRKNRGDSNDHT